MILNKIINKEDLFSDPMIETFTIFTEAAPHALLLLVIPDP